MDKLDLFTLAAQLADVRPHQIKSARLHPDGSLTAVVDLGIAGSPKRTYTPEQVAAKRQADPAKPAGAAVKTTNQAKRSKPGGA